jgi:hypothetical protein
MGKLNRKRNAVRMLEQAVRLTRRTADSRMSGRTTGRLQKEMHKYLAVLKCLQQDDPNDKEFWETLHKALSTIVKCLRHIDR